MVDKPQELPLRIFVPVTASSIKVSIPLNDSIGTACEMVFQAIYNSKTDALGLTAKSYGLYFPLGSRRELKFLSKKRTLAEYSFPANTQLLFKLRSSVASSSPLDGSVTGSVASNLELIKRYNKRNQAASVGHQADEDEDDDDDLTPPIDYIVCTYCNDVVRVENMENHPRFCHIKKQSTKLEFEGIDKRKEDPVYRMKEAIRAFFDNFDGIIHLLLSTLFAFFMGSMGFSPAWAILLIFLIFKMDKRIKARGWAAQLRDFEKKERLRKDLAMDEETLEWFNLYVEKFWPSLATILNVRVRDWLGKNLNNMRPTRVQSLEIETLEFGNIPPVLSHVRGIRLENDEPGVFLVEFDVAYAPDADLLLKANLTSLPTETLQIVVGEIFRLSVRIRDISIEGKMQVFLRFINEYPYLDIIQVAFKSNPKVDFSLQVMKTIELMDITFMNEWLSTSITSALSQYLVLPRNVRISLKEWWVPGSAAPTRVDAQPLEEFHKHATSLSSRYFHPDLDDGELSSYIQEYLHSKFDDHIQEVKQYKKSQKKRQKILSALKVGKDDSVAQSPTFYDLKELMEKEKERRKRVESPAFTLRRKKAGLGDVINRGSLLGVLKVAILRAQDLVLLSRFANFPDPYCILCVGEQYKKTDVRKSTLNPLWNQYFDFEVYEHEKRKVYLQVMDFNKLQNDEFMGRESIDFSDLLEFPTTEVEMWVHLKGAEVGQLQLSLTYYPSK